jgi:hypothetical protein
VPPRSKPPLKMGSGPPSENFNKEEPPTLPFTSPIGEIEDLKKEIEDLKRELASERERATSWKTLAQSRGRKIRGLQEAKIALTARIRRLKTTIPPVASG